MKYTRDDITPEEWAAAEGLDVGTAKWHWKAKGGRRGVAPEKETSLNLKDGGWTQIRFKVVAVPDNYPMAHGKAGEAPQGPSKAIVTCVTCGARRRGR